MAVGPATTGVLLEVGYDRDEDGRYVVVHVMERRSKYDRTRARRVMQMPRSYDEIVALSEEMVRSLEEDRSEPTIPPAESALRAAALRRSLAESDLGHAVVAARAAGVSWDRIGDAVGTSGEAARQKYGRLTAGVREVRPA